MVVTKTENGYTVDVSLGLDPITNKRLRKRKFGIKTKKEASDLESKYLRLYHESKLVTATNISLTDIFHIYRKEYTKNLKPSYQKSQERIFKNYVQPYFQDTYINKITSKQIRNFQEHLMNLKPERVSHLSNNTINMIILHVSKLFDVAIKENFTDQNPCKSIEKLKVAKKEIDFWTIQEFQQFISYIDEDQPYLKLFYQTAFFTGLRAGEMIALTWEDINFNRNEIKVDKSAKLIDGEYLTTEPKTKNSYRYVTINSRLAQQLDNWRMNQVNYLLDNFQNIDENKLKVFQYSEKHPSSDYFSKQIKRILIQNNSPLKQIRLHDLRHSHVALLINNNEDPTAVKQRLGHASITTTIDTYGHLYPNKQKSMSDKLDDCF